WSAATPIFIAFRLEPSRDRFHSYIALKLTKKSVKSASKPFCLRHRLTLLDLRGGPYHLESRGDRYSRKSAFYPPAKIRPIGVSPNRPSEITSIRTRRGRATMQLNYLSAKAI